MTDDFDVFEVVAGEPDGAAAPSVRKPRPGVSTMSTTKLFIRRLPVDATKDQLDSVFAEYGPIRTSFVVTKRGSKECTGIGFVQYTSHADAAAALKAMDNAKFFGARLGVSFARRRMRGVEPVSKPSQPQRKQSNKALAAIKACIVQVMGLAEKVTAKQIEKKVTSLCSGTIVEVDYPCGATTAVEGEARIQMANHEEAVALASSLHGRSFRGSQVKARVLAQRKTGRLVVRNLNFYCTEEQLRTAFAAHGDVESVSLLRKPNGHSRGVAFVQLFSLAEAQKAMEAVNGTKILGRVVAVDIAVSKADFDRANVSLASQPDSVGKPGTASPHTNAKGNKQHSHDQNQEEEEDEGEDEHDEEDEDEDEEGEGEEEGDSVGEAEASAPKVAPDDVGEGRTVFVRNLPFSASVNELRELVSAYGEVEGAWLVRNPKTQQPKGSAFIKFASAAGVKALLEVASRGTKADEARSSWAVKFNEACISLRSRPLIFTRAVERSKAKKLMARHEADLSTKDSRNLFLADEGRIVAGDPAAADLAAEDLARRAKWDADKRKKLLNPNYFVSRTRLSVRNLPKGTDSKALRTICMDAARTEGRQLPKILNCRVIRNDEDVSLGYGFVEFRSHHDALRALRHVNNNPSYFGPRKRPVVEFSVENRKAIERYENNLAEVRRRQRLSTTASKRRRQEESDGKSQRRNTGSKKRSKAKPSSVGSAGSKAAKSSRRSGGGKVKESKRGTSKRSRATPEDVADDGLRRNAAAKKVRRATVKKQGSRRKKAAKERDAFDSVVSSYKQRLFGDAKKGSSDTKRWFDE